MKRKWSITIGGGLLLAIASFAWLVWPTRYTYYEQQITGGARLLTRTDRFSGRVEFLYPGRGWELSSGDRSKEEAERWGEMQRRYPDVRVAALWQNVRQEFIAKGFAEPWSQVIQRDADSKFDERASYLQRRVNDSEKGVTFFEVTFLRILPLKLDDPELEIGFEGNIPPPPQGFRIEVPSDFTGGGVDRRKPPMGIRWKAELAGQEVPLEKLPPDLRYPALHVNVLWEDVRQNFINKGFTEPWSETTRRDASTEFDIRAKELQRRANAKIMAESVTVSELRFVKIAPEFIRDDPPKGK